MRDLVRQGFLEALNSVRADTACEKFCKVVKGDLLAGKLEYELKRFKRKYLVAVGKAACPMAQHMLDIIDFDAGLVATNRSCSLNSDKIKVFKSSHPLPDEESVKAADYLLELANQSKREDLFVFLITGGASSLIEKPKIDLFEYNKILDYMLKRHFSIAEINVIRKALSQIKGGKILRLINGEVASFVISDVVGDDLSTVGSGLTYYDRFTQKDFVEVCQKIKEFDLCRYNYDSLTKDEYLFRRVTNHIIANNVKACESLVDYYRTNGFNVLNLGSYFTGAVEWVRDVLFDSIDRAYKGMLGLKRPFALVFGGEPTVELTHDGMGGRCQHLALLMLEKLKGLEGEFAFSLFATDGKDGNSPYAGAIVDKQTINKAEQQQLFPENFLKEFNSSKFFELTDSFIDSFDTMTNVADIGVFVLR